MLSLYPEAYQNYIKRSSRKHILVEGNSDKNALKTLFDELGIDDEQYRIDVVEIINLTKKGAREKVEFMKDYFQSSEFNNKIILLVDREFRKFIIKNNKINDSLKFPRQDNKVLWTEGHSIENYYIGKALLHKSLRNSINNHNALNLFENNFEEIIRIIATISMLCHKKRYDWEKIIGSLEIDYFHFENEKITLNKALWKNCLSQRHLYECDTVINEYIGFCKVIDKTEIDTLIKYCHGHIFMNILKKIYAACQFYHAKNDVEKNKFIKNKYCSIKKEQFENIIISVWVTFCLNNIGNYPINILSELKLR